MFFIGIIIWGASLASTGYTVHRTSPWYDHIAGLVSPWLLGPAVAAPHSATLHPAAFLLSPVQRMAYDHGKENLRGLEIR